jgi:hypothetical protein
MLCKPILVIAVGVLLEFGVSPLFAGQTPGMQTTVPSQPNKIQKTLDGEMTDHQSEMASLLAKLEKSFQAVSDARDAKGFVRDKPVLKAHTANIKALRDLVRDHKLFLGAYERQCGVNGKQQDAMVEHQQEMNGALHNIVESFDAFEQANDQPNNAYIYVTMSKCKSTDNVEGK